MPAACSVRTIDLNSCTLLRGDWRQAYSKWGAKYDSVL